MTDSVFCLTKTPGILSWSGVIYIDQGDGEQIERGRHRSEGIKNHLSSNHISLIFLKKDYWTIESLALYIKELKTLLGKYRQQCRIDIL